VTDGFEQLARDVRVRARVGARVMAHRDHPLPDFVIIGAQRSGTTNLYRHLALHPQVRSPLRKEIQFLSLNWERGLPWYRRHFPVRAGGMAEQTFEASPYYLLHPQAPVRAAAALPEARFIALLREPVARATSHYLHNRRAGIEPLSFERALDLETARLHGETAGPNHRRYSYVTRGLYAEQIRRWQDAVGDRLLVVLSEDYFQTPVSTFSQLLSFLGLPEWAPDAFLSDGPGHARPGDVSEGVRRRLQERFAAPNRELAELLGRDLSAWADSTSSPVPISPRPLPAGLR
jgi:hypothetical protein